MRLISVQVLGNEDFRSLKVNKVYRFYKPSEENEDIEDYSTHTGTQLTKTVFTGVNGSGKSNFLQLLSEIFAYLETWHLNVTEKTVKQGLNFGFEIYYSLYFNEARLFFLKIENTCKQDQ